MKEATDILIKLIRTGELFLADEKTLVLVNAEPTYHPIFFERFEAGRPYCRALSTDAKAYHPVTLKVVEGPTPKDLHALFFFNPQGSTRYTPIGAFREHTSDGAVSVFEPIEVLGRPAREISFTEAVGTRKLEAVLTAELEGLPPDKASYRPAPAALLLTDQGGVIGVTREGADLLYEDLEGAMSDLMIYPEEIDVVRIAHNVKREGAPWFTWAKSKASLFPFEVRPFLKAPTRGAFSIPRDVCQRLVDVAQMGPDFISPDQGPPFLFLTAP